MAYKDPAKRLANQRAYRAAHPGQHRDYVRAYRARHRDRVRERDRLAKQAEREQDREAYNAQMRAYRLAHPEKVKVYTERHKPKAKALRQRRSPDVRARHLEANRRWHAEHPDKRLARHRRYMSEHPEKSPQYGATRRARVAGAAINDYRAQQRALVLENWGYTCVYCPYYKPGCPDCIAGTHTLVMDHYVAIVRGGNNTVANLRPACRSCNSRKKDRPAPDQLLL